MREYILNRPTIVDIEHIITSFYTSLDFIRKLKVGTHLTIASKALIFITILRGPNIWHEEISIVHFVLNERCGSQL